MCYWKSFKCRHIITVTLLGDSAVASALKEMPNLLGELVKRVESTEKKLKEIKTRSSLSSSTDSSPGTKPRYTVPLIVRVRGVITVYI